MFFTQWPSLEEAVVSEILFLDFPRRVWDTILGTPHSDPLVVSQRGLSPLVVIGPRDVGSLTGGPILAPPILIPSW